jgi:hypothetical protein
MRVLATLKDCRENVRRAASRIFFFVDSEQFLSPLGPFFGEGLFSFLTATFSVFIGKY